MRVLHIDAGKLYGGVETLLTTLARYRHLCPEMQPEFAVCFEGRLSGELRTEDVPVHILGEVRIRNPLSVWRGRQQLHRLLASQRFDAVVCHMAWPHAIFGPIAKKLSVPLVIWRHGASDGRHWLERWARRTRSDLVICNSRFTESSFESFADGVNTEVIYCPVAPLEASEKQQRMAVRAELNTPDDAVVVIQVGRMERSKGHLVHLRALAQLPRFLSWICWIIGGPQRTHETRYFSELQLEAQRLGISERVRFTGQRADVARLLHATDVFCQPNTGPESFGITFIEAMYAGLPVVTSAIGGALEIVDDSCGVLVPPADVTTLRDTLARLIGDPTSRCHLGANGPSRARALSNPARQLQRVLTALGDIINRELPSDRLPLGLPGNL